MSRLDGGGDRQHGLALSYYLTQNGSGWREDVTKLNLGPLYLLWGGRTDLNHNIAVVLRRKPEEILVQHNRLQQSPQIAGMKTITEARTT